MCLRLTCGLLRVLVRPVYQLALTAGPYCVVDATRFGRASLS
jgi:hypothetical protein